MRGSAISFVLHLGVCGALPLTAHPQRSAVNASRTSGVY
jgi:hypothetical protein